MLDTSNWKEFRIGDLFDISTGSLLKIKEVPFGNIPRISVKSDNNGILGYYDTENIPEARHVENFISVNFFGNAFYHPYKASLEMKVHCLKLKNKEFTERLGLYLVSALNKVFSQQNYSYGEQLSSSDLKNKELYIKIPVTNSGEPDWNFMEQYIAELEEERVAELEEERVAELEAYLIATELNDYELTDEDKEVLSLSGESTSYKDGYSKNVDGIWWKEFRIGDLFDVINNPQLDKENFTFGNNSKYPYFTRTENNNGILGYVDYLDDKHKIQGNSLAVGMISMKFHYMEHDFYAGQFTKTLIPKFDGFNETLASYFITLLNKHTPIYQAELVRHFANLVKETLVRLPVCPDKTPDFEYMEKYIRAIEKLTIKGVVEWKDKEIKTLKEIII